MLLQTIEALFRKYRLFCYQKLFAAVRESQAVSARRKPFPRISFICSEARRSPSLPKPSAFPSRTRPIRSISLLRRATFIRQYRRTTGARSC